MTSTAKTQTNDQLHAAVRYAGWKPADLRADASTLDDGCNIASPYMTAEVAAETAANMRAEADRIDAAAAEAEAELVVRRAAVPAFRGYVS